jgi:hypothetical protein
MRTLAAAARAMKEATARRRPDSDDDVTIVLSIITLDCGSRESTDVPERAAVSV